MRVLLLTEHWPSVDGGFCASPQAVEAVREAWHGTRPDHPVHAFAVGDGGPRSADVYAGARTLAGGAEVVDLAGARILAPARGARRWEPGGLATALLGLAADAAPAGAASVVVPVGDEPPAGDATDVWLGGLGAMRDGLRALDVRVAVTSQRPLLGLRGMSAALRDGREADSALAVASQQQEDRWSGVAREADPQATRSLVGPARLSDAPGAGAAGGLAYCLAAAGARIVPAGPTMAALAGADEVTADLVIAVIARLEPRTLDQGAVAAASRLAATTGVPCVIVAPESGIGRRDLMNAGVAAAHAGSPGLDGLRDAVRRVAQTWAR